MDSAREGFSQFSFLNNNLLDKMQTTELLNKEKKLLKQKLISFTIIIKTPMRTILIQEYSRSAIHTELPGPSEKSE